MTYPPEPRWGHLPRRETPDQPTQDRVTTYEEWRVTGTWVGQSYTFTWSPIGPPAWEFPQQEARNFIETFRNSDAWTDGPHLHKRTVTVTEWEAVQ